MATPVHEVPDVILQSADARIAVSPATGRITSFAVRGVELLHQGPRFGAFPMAPWCGRMRDGVLTVGDEHYRFETNDPPHAIHGTVRDHPWVVAHRDDDTLRLTQRLEPRWPFAGEVVQEFRLEPSTLTLRMTVSSAEAAFPAQVGWHPWFARRLDAGAAELQVRFSPAWQEQRGDDYLPTGTRIAPQPPPWDDCFGMPDGVDVTLDWPETLRLHVRSDARWVVVFDHRDYAICVEPQTGPPDGLNTAPVTVTPEAPLSATTEWSW